MSPRRSSEPATPSVASVTETKHRTIMNKKQYNSIWAGSLALLLLAGSCSKSDETAAPEPSDGRIVVRALASDSGQAPSFDRFGLYIVQKAAEGSEALAGERLHANVEFTRSGDTYVSTPAIAFPGAKKLRFDLYAYAPYRETALEAGAVTLPLALAADQQDDAAYTAADLRFSKRTNYAAVTGDVAMEFAHAMSRHRTQSRLRLYARRLRFGRGRSERVEERRCVLIRRRRQHDFRCGGRHRAARYTDAAGRLFGGIVGHRHSTKCRSRRTARRNYGDVRLAKR